ncbi:MAG: 4-alpha-glucanotransferase [Dorea sp.]
MNKLKRVSGVLLHPTSLPSRYGIGDLGQEAYDFVDFLHDSGQHIWQILPLTHTGYGDSPYQSFSAFAGQPLLISPTHLKTLNLVQKEDLADCPVTDEEHIDYGTIIPWKTKVCKLAYKNFLTGAADAKLTVDFEKFCEEQKFWLFDYALFMACKDVHSGKSWLEWNDEYQQPTKELKEKFYTEHKDEVCYYQFLQFIFFMEWHELKDYANDMDIKIIGDIPIFVSMDSADVWANQQLFQLDAKGHPLNVAGVPPDYFSATGQLWGNPLYDWDAHKKEGFAWWISRIKSQLKNIDILRIDHFRGFEAYWSIPYGEKTAINGKWIKAPGSELFTAIQNALGDDLPIIAEDLGIITPGVEALRDEFAFPGMKVLQFAFNSTDEGDYLPHQYQNPNCICYTGTHDNDTTVGWFSELNADCQKKTLRYTKTQDADDISWGMIELALSSIAAYAIFPLQDILSCSSDARMNTPGVASGNWGWRYKEDDLTSEIADKLKELTILYGRHHKKQKDQKTNTDDGKVVVYD